MTSFFSVSRLVGGRRLPRRAPRSEREPYRRIFGFPAPVGAPGEPRWARGHLQRKLGRIFLLISSASRLQSEPQGVYEEVWGRFLQLLGPSRRPRRAHMSERAPTKKLGEDVSIYLLGFSASRRSRRAHMSERVTTKKFEEDVSIHFLGFSAPVDDL